MQRRANSRDAVKPVPGLQSHEPTAWTAMNSDKVWIGLLLLSLGMMIAGIVLLLGLV